MERADPDVGHGAVKGEVDACAAGIHRAAVSRIRALFRDVHTADVEVTGDEVFQHCRWSLRGTRLDEEAGEAG